MRSLRNLCPNVCAESKERMISITDFAQNSLFHSAKMLYL